MAEPTKPGSAVPLEEVVPAQAFEFEALLNVLERRGFLKRTEVLEEIDRLRKTAAKAQRTRQGSSCDNFSVGGKETRYDAPPPRPDVACHARRLHAGWGSSRLEGLTADEQLEVASQLTMAILKAARQRFEASQGDRHAYNTLCDRVVEWFGEEIAALRFGRVQ